MLQDEAKVSLTDAAKQIPGRPNPSTLWRWCRKGLNGVRLEYARYGRRIYTSVEAIHRFAERVAAADNNAA